MLALDITAAAAVILAGYGFYKYKTVKGIETELQVLEAAAETDAKKVIAAVKAKL